MAAAAYKVSMAVSKTNGQKKIVPMAGSDVNAAFWTYPSGATSNALSAEPCFITDLVYTAAGTDTSQVYLFINGINTGIIIYNATNLASTYNRTIQQSPISIPAGALVSFQQIT
jgi:hypothetical protein